MAARPLQPSAGLAAEGWQPPWAAGGRRQRPSQDSSAEASSESTAEDLMYGPGVFQKLPEWMTRIDADSEDEDEDVPYGYKLNELLAGVGDDGETRSPASETPAELSSGSDDESGSGAPALRGACGNKYTSETLAPVSTAGHDCRYHWPESGRPEDRCFAEEDRGLVDLDPEEGRRRGAIILAMLAEKPEGAPAEEGEAASAAAPPAPWQGQARPEAAARRGPAAQPQPGCWAQGASPGSPAAAAACAGKAATHAVYANIVCEAACHAFGSGAVDVANSASGGFVIWLCGWPALDLQRNHQAVLETLSQALWPYLGQDVVAVEQRTAVSAAGTSGARLSGVASAVAGTKLTLWCLAEEAKYEQSFCWQYVRSGVCPRGALCRWRHAMPPTFPIDIEVAAS